VDGERYFVAGELRIPGGAFHNPLSHMMGGLELRVYIERDDTEERVWELPPKFLDYSIVCDAKRLRVPREDFNRYLPSAQVGRSGWVFALMGRETIGFIGEKRGMSACSDSSHAVQRMGALDNSLFGKVGVDSRPGHSDWIRLYPAIERSKLPLLWMQMRPTAEKLK